MSEFGLTLSGPLVGSERNENKTRRSQKAGPTLGLRCGVSVPFDVTKRCFRFKYVSVGPCVHGV